MHDSGIAESPAVLAFDPIADPPHVVVTDVGELAASLTGR